VKVPTYKWVVEEVPCDSGDACECGEIVATDGPAMPKPPGEKRAK